MSVWVLDERKLRRERCERDKGSMREREIEREMRDLRCKEFSLWVRDKSEAESLRVERRCVR